MNVALNHLCILRKETKIKTRFVLFCLRITVIMIVPKIRKEIGRDRSYTSQIIIINYSLP